MTVSNKANSQQVQERLEQQGLDEIIIRICTMLGFSVASVMTSHRGVGRPEGDGLIRIIVHGLVTRAATEAGYSAQSIGKALRLHSRTVIRYRNAWRHHAFLASPRPQVVRLNVHQAPGKMTGPERGEDPIRIIANAGIPHGSALFMQDGVLVGAIVNGEERGEEVPMWKEELVP